MFALFKQTPEYPTISSAILGKLAECGESTDMEYLCDLAGQMAIYGDDQAAEALRSYVLDQDFLQVESPCGWRALTSLDGQSVAVEYAMRAGRLLQQTPQAWIDEPGDLLADAQAVASTMVTLQRLAKFDIFVAVYLESLKQRDKISNDTAPLTKEDRQRMYLEETRKAFPLESLLSAAKVKKQIGIYYQRFGMAATEEELAEVYRHLLVEPDEDVCERLLRVFRKVPLPGLDQKIWSLAASHDQSVRDATHTALAQCNAPEVGIYARAQIQADGFSATDSEVFRLFVKNYLPQDSSLILAALQRLNPDEYEAHSLVLRLLDIFGENRTPELTGAMLWAYEHTPCSLCRNDVVSGLLDIAQLPSHLIEECMHDALDETRERARGAAMAIETRTRDE
ncbi:hypothetical protein [Chitinimonas naiadis]